MYSPMLLTRSTGILGPIATILGYLMNGIFFVLNKIGIPNIGLAIIIFTIIIYMCLMPLTIQQQKFSKLQAKMQPELQAIQDKYKGRKDNDSAMRMNEETQAVYRKYGVSPTGSCVQLLIQMPILFALYRVIYNFPAYVTQVKEAFFPLVTNLSQNEAAVEFVRGTSAAAQFMNQFNNDNFVNNVGDYVSNTLVDVLNRFSTADWTALSEAFPALTADIAKTQALLERYNNFLGLNIGNSPWFTLRNAIAAGSVLTVIGAILIPVLSAVTQLLNVALMPQPQNSNNSQADSMASSMKMMNYTMPIMSAYFCFMLPAGMGLYWVAGSVIRSVQQVVINRSINKMDLDAYIAENLEKQKKKDARRGGRETVSQKLMNQYSNMNTKNIEAADRSKVSGNSMVSELENQKKLEKARNLYSTGKYKEGSLASKANMVAAFNDSKKAGPSSKNSDAKK